MGACNTKNVTEGLSFALDLAQILLEKENDNQEEYLRRLIELNQRVHTDPQFKKEHKSDIIVLNQTVLAKDPDSPEE